MHFRVQRSKNTEQIRILFILLGGSLICETSFNYLSVSYYYDFFLSKMASPQTYQITTTKCKVCGASAGKHNYYGARCCISCRGFFRRSVQSNHYKSFDCKVSNCVVDVKTRKNCKKCRFDKCLRIGMRINWVLTDEERYERMLQRKSPRKQFPVQNFSQEEQDRAHLLYDVTMEIFNRLYYKMYAADLGMLRSMFVHGFEGRPFSFLEVKFFESMDRFVITELMFKMFRIHNVVDERVTQVLAKHNVPRLIGLYQSLICKVI